MEINSIRSCQRIFQRITVNSSQKTPHENSIVELVLRFFFSTWKHIFDSFDFRLPVFHWKLVVSSTIVIEIVRPVRSVIVGKIREGRRMKSIGIISIFDDVRIVSLRFDFMAMFVDRFFIGCMTDGQIVFFLVEIFIFLFSTHRLFAQLEKKTKDLLILLSSTNYFLTVFAERKPRSQADSVPADGPVETFVAPRT